MQIFMQSLYAHGEGNQTNEENGTIDTANYGSEDVGDIELDESNNENSVVVPPTNVQLSNQQLHHLNTQVDPTQEDGIFGINWFLRVLDIINN